MVHSYKIYSISDIAFQLVRRKKIYIKHEESTTWDIVEDRVK